MFVIFNLMKASNHLLSPPKLPIKSKKSIDLKQYLCTPRANQTLASSPFTPVSKLRLQELTPKPITLRDFGKVLNKEYSSKWMK